MVNQVQVKNVYRNFGAVKAVDGVSIEIKKGEFFSLLGPSGCGKTTLLRLIAGFETPNFGEIMIGCEDGSLFFKNLINNIK